MRVDFRAPFPAWGEGVFFFVRHKDLIELEALYGAGEVIGEVEKLLSRCEASVFEPLIRHGLKIEVDEKMQAVEMPNDIFEHMSRQGITTSSFQDVVMDGLMMQTQGRTYADALEEARKIQQDVMERLARSSKEGDPDDPFDVPAEPNDPSSSDTGQD